MADRIVISNVQPFDGAYPLDLEEAPFTTREWRWIKQLSGYLPGTVQQGFEGGDPDLVVALAVIAMVRANKISRDDVTQTADQLADVPHDGARITFQAEQQETDARPPEPNENGNSSPTGSGESSSPPTGRSANHQSPIGEPTSPTPAISGPVT